MNITFQKRQGTPSLNAIFFWRLTVESTSPISLRDHFIPELFFDYFFIRKGKVRCIDKALGTEYSLPQQSLKTLHTHPLTFVLSTPLVLYGVRLSLKFAESFRGEIQAHSFLEQKWAEKDPDDLDSFKSQVEEHLAGHRIKRSPYPMISADLEESQWLVHFSQRHKRRLYRMIFSLSRKELQNIRNLQAFLEQGCDFDSQTPRIIRHVNPEVFYDQPHLNHTFRKLTGFSPLEYFQANSILQDHLMSASYNEVSDL